MPGGAARELDIQPRSPNRLSYGTSANTVGAEQGDPVKPAKFATSEVQRVCQWFVTRNATGGLPTQEVLEDRPVANRRTALSKLLSYVLRHDPGRFGLSLGAGGWVSIDDLLVRCREHGRPITREQLDHLVATNSKRRFAISEDGTMIRASQGHSVAVDLGLAALEPPEVLYHGTVAPSLPAIRAEGLRKMERQHVHLSPDPETARVVGQRRGSPVVLRIAAAAMHRAGHVFHCADNGVWLTDHVPPSYISDHP